MFVNSVVVFIFLFVVVGLVCGWMGIVVQFNCVLLLDVYVVGCSVCVLCCSWLGCFTFGWFVAVCWVWGDVTFGFGVWVLLLIWVCGCTVYCGRFVGGL